MTDGAEASSMDRPAGTGRTETARKALLYRLFKIGRVPWRLLAALQAEGLVLLDEGLRGSVGYRSFRAPGKRFSRRREWFTGALALTRVRFAAFAYGRRLVNVPLDDPRLAEIEVRAETPGSLLAAFDAGLFHPERSGRVEIRFRTDLAATIADHLRARTSSRPGE